MDNKVSVNGKDANGHFTKGHTFSVGNRGNYHPRDTYRQRMIKATSFEEVQQVMGKVKSLALQEDNVPAARLWLEYILGKSPQAVELSGPGGMPLVTQIVMPIIMRALERHPDAREEITQALAQLQLESPADPTSPPDPK